jgi:acetyl-CoA carboxylase biotin carboxyl carrier protein
MTDQPDPQGATVTEMRAEMAANVWKIVVEDGAEVAVGDTLVILESMKMEIPVEAEAAGTVTMAIEEGQSVDEDDLLATIQ